MKVRFLPLPLELLSKRLFLFVNFLTFLSKYRPLSSEQGKFRIILVNCVKRSHRC